MLPAHRTRLYWFLALLGLVLGTGLAVRYWVGGYVVRSVLRMAGAAEIRHGAIRATPWRVEIENLNFKIRSQSFAAGRVTLQRANWWMASLGDVQVAGARIPVVLDGSQVDPWNWATYEDGGLGDEPVPPPFRSLQLEGELLVRMANLPDRPVRVTLESQPKSAASWVGSLVAEGEGFRLAGGGALLRAGQELDFQVLSAELDLAVWSGQIQRLVPLPGGPWELGGRLTGVAEGKVTAKRFAATARVNLREGRMGGGKEDIAVTGAEAELEFSDLWKLRTKFGALRVADLRIGRLPLRAVTADFGLWDGTQIRVKRAEATALGGRVTAEDFNYQLNERSLALGLRVADVRAADLLALTAGVTPRLSGRVSGDLPLRIQGDGVRVSGGGLALQPGQGAELQLNAAALLRSGAPMSAATAGVLKAAGSASVVLRLDQLQFEVRPPGLPLGTSARVRVAGRVDGIPVEFTYQVNGAVERFLRILPARR
ncbi:Dicarboxylate transport [Lacunisphaera limnophila]|uniref:Dicarboxylate transport n=1 Tax=Lacunisphaera limnophila TaxID=1838286 RepID=A0A1D8AXP7_9BACT|nr:YdbH domain-containing protein [Lacunisphaera limnophila]AOS45665.1 Dicarboxylate transport [Lacunisphaera limnophila]